MERSIVTRWTLGIDPGKNGAAVLLDSDGRIMRCWDTTTIKTGTKVTFDLVAMVRIVRIAAVDGAHVAIEQVHAMPGQGVTSMFEFGRGFGIWQGVIAAQLIPVSYYAPQAWQRTQLAGMPKGKGSSRLRAKEIWPRDDLFDRVKDDGRADAALIARHHQGTR